MPTTQRNLALRIAFKVFLVLTGAVFGILGAWFWEEWMEERRRVRHYEDQIHWARIEAEEALQAPRGPGAPRLHLDEMDWDTAYQDRVN